MTAVVAVFDTIVASSPPRVTSVRFNIPVPVSVRVLPPSEGPALGETVVIVGATGAV